MDQTAENFVRQEWRGHESPPEFLVLSLRQAEQYSPVWKAESPFEAQARWQAPVVQVRPRGSIYAEDLLFHSFSTLVHYVKCYHKSFAMTDQGS